MITRGILMLVACGLLASSAAAQAKPDRVEYDWKRDGAITLGASLAWVVSETLLKSQLAPASCRWCDDNAMDRAVRDALRWDDREAAHLGSNVTSYLLAPASALGFTALAALHDGRKDALAGDALIVLEATILAVDLNQLVKFVVGRQRPLVRAGVDYPADDANLSFYSGHTTLAFVLATSSATVASMRGYRWAPWIWGTGLTVAAASGYLRLAADRHYLSDVVVGAVIGSAVGIAVPYFFHRKGDDRLPAPQLTSGGLALGWSGRW